eukprot:479717_1
MTITHPLTTAIICYLLLLNMNNSLKWMELTPNANWSAREDFDTVIDKESNIIITGGHNQTSVWKSQPSNNYIANNWTLLCNQTGMLYRQGAATVILMNTDHKSQQTILSMAGCNANYDGYNDVWSSIDDGNNWNLVNPSSKWGKRCYFNAINYNNSILVLGGYSKTGFFNDVWSSTNYGIDWTQITANSGWSARDAFGAVVINDSIIFVFGGHDGSNNLSQWRNDVWKSLNGGENWILVTEHAEWSGRRLFATTVWKNNIILMGGGGPNNAIYNDVWISSDGKDWKEILADNMWSKRQRFGAETINDNIYVLGGDSAPFGPSTLNDVWVLDLSNYVV